MSRLQLSLTAFLTPAITTLSVFLNVAVAERIDICSNTTFQQQSGSFCSFTTEPGEQINVQAMYRDTTSGDTADVRLQPYGNSVSVPANAGRHISRQINTGEAGDSHIEFNINHFATKGDYLDLEVWRERSNLYVTQPPSIDPANGQMSVPWGVSTEFPFITSNYITVVVSGNSSGTVTGEQYLGEWGLDDCFLKARCKAKVIVPFGQRRAIDRGKSWLAASIDPYNLHTETNGNDNIASRRLDDFFIESIPGIQRAHAANWNLAADLLDLWFNSSPNFKSSSTKSFDWNLPPVVAASGDTTWFLDPNNAATDAVRSNFNWLKKPENFNTTKTRKVLRKHVVANFAANPGAKTLPISFPWSDGSDVQQYHEQQIQFREGQSRVPHLDPVTAAFGDFSFYLVPIGEATKNTNTKKYNIKITAIAIHVTDSFDFNNSQFLGIGLGCWALPDKVSPSPWPGYECVDNPDFRYYRYMKARGGDYNVFVRPYVLTLPTPIPVNLSF